MFSLTQRRCLRPQEAVRTIRQPQSQQQPFAAASQPQQGQVPAPEPRQRQGSQSQSRQIPVEVTLRQGSGLQGPAETCLRQTLQFDIWYPDRVSQEQHCKHCHRISVVHSIFHDGVRRGIDTNSAPATGPPAAAVPVSRGPATAYGMQTSIVAHAAMHSIRSVQSLGTHEQRNVHM